MAPTATSSRAGRARAPGRGVRRVPHRRASRRSCARRSTWARGRSRSSAATRTSGRERFGISGLRRALHAHRAAVPRRRASRRWSGSAPRSSRAGLWEALDTSWLVLDCELLPWSAKAMELIRRQYAAVGAAGRVGAGRDRRRARDRRGARAGRRRAARRARATGPSACDRYCDAYRRYIWPVAGPRRPAARRRSTCSPPSPAPSRAATTAGTSSTATRWSPPTRTGSGAPTAASSRSPTRASEAEATAWWEAMTAAGGEGMVVKPMTFTARGRRGLVQPGIKVRGREYLRIIYGPEYDAPGQLDRLRSRGLGRKRSLASREFALGRRGARALRAPRAAVPRARVRLRRSWRWSPSRSTRACNGTLSAQTRSRDVTFSAAAWGYVRQDNQRFPSRPHPPEIAARQRDLITHGQLLAVGPDAAGDLQTGARGERCTGGTMGSTRSAGHRCHPRRRTRGSARVRPRLGASSSVAGEAPRRLAFPGAADRGRLSSPPEGGRRRRASLPHARAPRPHRPPRHPGHDGAPDVRGPRRRADAAPVGERDPHGRVPGALRGGGDPGCHGALQRPPRPRDTRAGDGAAPDGERGDQEQRRGRLSAAPASPSRS